MRFALIILLLAGCAAPDYSDTVLAVRPSGPYIQARYLSMERALADVRAANERRSIKQEHLARLRLSRTNQPPLPR